MERGEEEATKVWGIGRMACWPANVVGAFFVALIGIDVVREDWVDLPFHGIIGIIMTGLFYFICMFLGESVSAAIIVVPAVFITISGLTLWFASQSLKNQRCCLTCKGPVKCNGPSPTPTPPKESCRIPNLGIKATIST